MTDHKAKPKHDGHDTERFTKALAKRARRRMIRLINQTKGAYK